MCFGLALIPENDVFYGYCDICDFSSAVGDFPPASISEPNFGVPVPLVFPARDPESDASRPWLFLSVAAAIVVDDSPYVTNYSS